MALSVDAKTKKFFKFLNEDLDFDDASKISSAKIHRLFENQAVEPLLTEFVQTLSQENVVSEFENEDYSQIVEQGKCKNGNDLQRSLDWNRKLNEDYERQKSEVRKNIERMKKRKETLEFEITQMEEMKRQQQRREEDLKGLANQSNNILREDKSECQTTRTQVTQTLSTLDTTFQSLCQVVEAGDDNGHLVSQLSLQDLLQAEEAYNMQLTSFVKKQFYEISETISKDLSSDGEEHELCSIGDEHLLLGESEDVRKEMANNIRRAELGYPGREKCLFSAQAKSSAAESALAFFHHRNRTMQDAEEICSAEDLRSTLSNTMSKATHLKEQVRELSHHKIPELVEQGTPLQTTHLLTGDYRRKLVRQEYFIEKQKKVINLLLQQQARLDLLWMLLSLEEARHKKTAKQVPAVLAELKSILDLSVEETERFLRSKPNEEPAQPRSVIDERDTVAVQLHGMLGAGTNGEDVRTSGKPASLFRHFDGLRSAAEHLRKKLDCLRKDVTAQPNCDEVAISELGDAMTRCENLLHAGVGEEGSGDCDLLVLTPGRITKMTSYLQEQFNKLSSLIQKNTNEIDKKKCYLEHHKKAALARSMWVAFFLHPDSLESCVESLRPDEG